MKHRFGVLLFTLVLAPMALGQTNRLFGGLAESVARMRPTETAVVVVTFNGNGPVSQVQRLAVSSLGITRGLTFQSLPIMGVVATAAQIRALGTLAGVRSVYPNKQLQYFNYDARHLTGVERLRTDSRLRTAQGLPFTGKGITVLVNDSGIDGTHPDLKYGDHLKVNVLGSTNLNAVSSLLPVTYTEGIPNTDISSGHGTHCAGSVAGTGAQSGGQHAGMAPGADLVGYGSGAVIAILDGIGGFDYAITHQTDPRHAPIRVITNSWGSTGAFDPNDPINYASYAAYQRGITVLFAAGNEGPGEDTHNPYAVAPWVISVGAGDKLGRLADFSSRGKRGQSGTFTTPDGQTWTYVNEPTIVSPGVRIVSTRANTGALPLLEAEADADLPPGQIPFYTHMDGTSMATPIAAGITALVLEANPALQPADVKRILKATATNMPGHESWEVGAGYINAYDAVVMALGRRTDFGATVSAGRTFNASAILNPGATMPFSVDFSPVGDRDAFTFEVGADVALVSARATVDANTVAIRLTDPKGNSYGSAIALPALGSDIAISAPGVPGTWTLTAGGVGFVSGNDVDPAGVTNGYGLPGTVEGTIGFTLSGGYSGLNDIAGDPAKGAIEAGVSHRLVDGLAGGVYNPSGVLTRAMLAQFAVMGLGVRQNLPLAGGFSFGDVSGPLASYAEAVAARGGALRDRFQTTQPLFRASGSFGPDAAVTRADLAYTLVQSLGLQGAAESLNAAFAAGTKTMAVNYADQLAPLTDAGTLPADLKGYVQLALDLGLMNARFALTQGPYESAPTITASFNGATAVTRGAYAVSALATMNAFRSGDVAAALGYGTSTSSALPALAQSSTTTTTLAPGVVTFSTPFPNPARTSATLRFSLPEASRVRLTVFDALGREVARLADGEQAAGTHTATLDVAGLAPGTYVGRLEAGGRVATQRLVVVR